MSRCEVCDNVLIWAGTLGFLPHSDLYHAQVRQRLMRAVVYLLWEKAAVRAGHTVTIRFTQHHAWAECACGWTSPRFWESSHTRTWVKMQHLYGIGETLCRSDEV